jgi:hypothetical protein
MFSGRLCPSKHPKAAFPPLSAIYANEPLNIIGSIKAKHRRAPI